MNKTNAKDYLPLVQALADGKTIQLRLGVYDKYHPMYDSTEWRDIREHDHRFSYPPDRYRVKPEPVVAESWTVLWSDGYTSLPVKTLDDARPYARTGNTLRTTPTHFVHYIITDGIPKAEFLPIKF